MPHNRAPMSRGWRRGLDASILAVLNSNTEEDIVGRLRQAYRQWLSTIGITHFVTFNFGYRVKPMSAFYAMKGLCCRVERMAFGRNYAKHRGNHRLLAIGFPERPNQNPHWHAAIRSNPDTQWILEFYGPTMWDELEPRGQLWVEPIDDKQKVISYSTKRLSLIGVEDLFLY